MNAEKELFLLALLASGRAWGENQSSVPHALLAIISKVLSTLFPQARRWMKGDDELEEGLLVPAAAFMKKSERLARQGSRPRSGRRGGF